MPMSAVAAESKRTWILAVLAASVTVAGVMALFREPSPPAPPPARVKPTVELPVPGNLLTSDWAAFKDPIPLFLPTKWNSSPPERDRREPEGDFNGYGPIYTFSVNDLQLNLPASIAVPARPADALVENAPGNPFLGFGRADVAVSPLTARWAFVEIVAAASGRTVFTRELADEAAVKGAASPLREGTWQPLEFMAAVDAAGLVGQLTPVVRPEAAADDPFLQLPGKSLAILENYLAQKLRIGDRLPPVFIALSSVPETQSRLFGQKRKFAVDDPTRDPHFQPSFTFFDRNLSDCLPEKLSKRPEAFWQAVIWSAQIAQLAEHVLGKDEVAGSNPVLGSRAGSVGRFSDAKQKGSFFNPNPNIRIPSPWLKVHSNAKNRMLTSARSATLTTARPP